MSEAHLAGGDVKGQWVTLRPHKDHLAADTAFCEEGSESLRGETAGTFLAGLRHIYLSIYIYITYINVENVSIVYIYVCVYLFLCVYDGVGEGRGGGERGGLYRPRERRGEEGRRDANRGTTERLEEMYWI